MAEKLQFSLNYDGKLPPSAEIGMAAADEHANERWKRWVDGCVMAVAEQMETFTVDDVIGKLNALPYPPSTRNLAALGPRMKMVAKELKYMTGTDQVRRSTRPNSHGNFLRVWKSNLFKG